MSVLKKYEKHPSSFRVTETPFKEAEQHELNSPSLSFEEHNKERVLRSAGWSSLFTQGTVRVRERRRRMKERKDMGERQKDMGMVKRTKMDYLKSYGK